MEDTGLHKRAPKGSNPATLEQSLSAVPERVSLLSILMKVGGTKSEKLYELK